MTSERALFQAFVQAADGYQRESVSVAAANVLMNVLRQSHNTLGAAEEELDALVSTMKRELACHYGADGHRRRLVLPPLVMT